MRPTMRTNEHGIYVKEYATTNKINSNTYTTTATNTNTANTEPS